MTDRCDVLVVAGPITGLRTAEALRRPALLFGCGDDSRGEL
jgi:hypothetical protein